RDRQDLRRRHRPGGPLGGNRTPPAVARLSVLSRLGRRVWPGCGLHFLTGASTVLSNSASHLYGMFSGPASREEVAPVASYPGYGGTGPFHLPGAVAIQPGKFPQPTGSRSSARSRARRTVWQLQHFELGVGIGSLGSVLMRNVP